jgi:hypothetical protein
MDMLVSVKVILDGTTRRFKRPLGDLGVKSLETQVRHKPQTYLLQPSLTSWSPK